MSTFTTLESRMKLPSTIDYGFLKRNQRSKSTFYLAKRPTPSAHLSYFLAQDQIDKFPVASLTRYIQKNLQPIPDTPLDTLKLEKLESCFERAIKLFTTRSELLSEIKREYSLVIQSLINIEKEIKFLSIKSQGLLCQNGNEDLVDTLVAERRDLETVSDTLERDRRVRLEFIKEKEHQLILHLGKLFKKELVEATDDRQRLYLQYKGRMGYIKDWLSERLNEHPVFEDLFRDVERDPQYFRLLFERDDETIQRFDSPDVKRVKMEIADQRKRGETLKKDIEKVQKKMETIQKLGREKDEKMDDLRLLLASRVKTMGAFYPPSDE